MTTREATKLGQQLAQLFGQVYARQPPTGWKVNSPAEAATLILLDWAGFCLRNHLLPEKIVAAALDGMCKRPLKTADQQEEEFRSVSAPPQTKQPVPRDGGGNHVDQGQQGDARSTGGGPGSTGGMAAPTPGEESEGVRPDDYE